MTVRSSVSRGSLDEVAGRRGVGVERLDLLGSSCANGSSALASLLRLGSDLALFGLQMSAPWLDGGAMVGLPREGLSGAVLLWLGAIKRLGREILLS